MTDGYIASFDVGDRRIGVAIASTIARIATPYTTVDRQKVLDIDTWVNDFIASNDVVQIVIGLPRDMNGQDTNQTAITEAFITNLNEAVDIPVATIDEAVSSITAESRLKQLGKPYSKPDIDAEAACIILEDYLASNNR